MLTSALDGSSKIIAKMKRFRRRQARDSRQVAITVDDVPASDDGGSEPFSHIFQMNKRLLAAFQEQQIPVTGFVNAGGAELTADQLRAILDLWLDAGAELGNHTFAHSDLNVTPLEEYMEDILQGEAILRETVEARGKQLKFFRYPFLHEGQAPEAKRTIQQFLLEGGYRNAPVTLNNLDYIFAKVFLAPEFEDRVKQEYVRRWELIVEFVERWSVQLTGRQFPQILLLHANELNSRMAPAILQMFARRKYQFIPLDEALSDPVYQSPENYIGPDGCSFLHRLARTRGLPLRFYPGPPRWILEAFQESTVH